MLVIINRKLIFFLVQGRNWIVKGLILVHDDLTSINEYMFLACFILYDFDDSTKLTSLQNYWKMYSKLC